MITQERLAAFNALKEQFPQRDSRGYISWKGFKNDEWRRAFIEHRAAIFYEANGSLNQHTLKKEGYSWLSFGAQKYHGGMRRVAEVIGLFGVVKKHNYWSKERVNEESQQFITVHGELNYPLLVQNQRTDLLTAIQNSYGSLKEFRDDLESKREPDRLAGFSTLKAEFPPRSTTGKIRWGSFRTLEWREAYIQWEAAKFLDTHGLLTSSVLRENKYDWLRSAIHSHYPGGEIKLKEDLGIPGKKPKGYWHNPATIELEWLKAQEAGLGQGYSDLAKSGQHGLALAIAKLYPGGMHGLLAKFNLEAPKKPVGFWDEPANIESEVQKLIESGLELNLRALFKLKGYSPLINAISQKYPGGMAALRRKFNIFIGNEVISPEDANADLEKLLEGEGL